MPSPTRSPPCPRSPIPAIDPGTIPTRARHPLGPVVVGVDVLGAGDEAHRRHSGRDERARLAVGLPALADRHDEGTAEIVADDGERAEVEELGLVGDEDAARLDEPRRNEAPVPLLRLEADVLDRERQHHAREEVVGVARDETAAAELVEGVPGRGEKREREGPL